MRLQKGEFGSKLNGRMRSKSFTNIFKEINPLVLEELCRQDRTVTIACNNLKAFDEIMIKTTNESMCYVMGQFVV